MTVSFSHRSFIPIVPCLWFLNVVVQATKNVLILCLWISLQKYIFMISASLAQGA